MYRQRYSGIQHSIKKASVQHSNEAVSVQHSNEAVSVQHSNEAVSVQHSNKKAPVQPISSDYQLETKTATPSGGYEHEFLDMNPDKYKCMICHKVQREATIISCCCKHYCNSCIEEWFRKQGRYKRCPHCRSGSFNHFVNKERVQDINELRLYCSNREAGCEWVGKLEELESHVDSECDYTRVDCPNECHEIMQRVNLESHKQNDCLLRLNIVDLKTPTML